jgi:hypothetical protein
MTHASANRHSCRSAGCCTPTSWPPTRLLRCSAVQPPATSWMWRPCLSGTPSSSSASWPPRKTQVSAAGFSPTHWPRRGSPRRRLRRTRLGARDRRRSSGQRGPMAGPTARCRGHVRRRRWAVLRRTAAAATGGAWLSQPSATIGTSSTTTLQRGSKRPVTVPVSVQWLPRRARCRLVSRKIPSNPGQRISRS